MAKKSSLYQPLTLIHKYKQLPTKKAPQSEANLSQYDYTKKTNKMKMKKAKRLSKRLAKFVAYECRHCNISKKNTLPKLVGLFCTSAKGILL